MSYCRWSSDDYNCDLYIYESVGDFWALHIASSRYIIKPKVGEYNDREELYKDSNFEKIDLPHAGGNFEFGSPGECADFCEELKKLGYCFPDYVIPSLREEQEEMDKGECQ